jgi:hypothetical protein
MGRSIDSARTISFFDRIVPAPVRGVFAAGGGPSYVSNCNCNCNGN